MPTMASGGGGVSDKGGGDDDDQGACKAPAPNNDNENVSPNRDRGVPDSVLRSLADLHLGSKGRGEFDDDDEGAAPNDENSSPNRGGGPPRPAREEVAKETVRKVLDAALDLDASYYSVLGLATDATFADIGKSYRRLALRLHPDKTSVPGAKQALAEVRSAYEVLSDPTKRAKYDEEEAAYDREHPPSLPTPRGTSAGRVPSPLSELRAPARRATRGSCLYKPGSNELNTFAAGTRVTLQGSKWTGRKGKVHGVGRGDGPPSEQVKYQVKLVSTWMDRSNPNWSEVVVVEVCHVLQDVVVKVRESARKRLRTTAARIVQGGSNGNAIWSPHMRP